MNYVHLYPRGDYPAYCIPACVTPYYQYVYHQTPYRQYNSVDATFFNESAKSMQILMNDASIVLKKLATSKTFANKVMSAAQQSNMSEVENLFKSTGIKSEVETTFNPDGINLKMSSKVGNTDCCHLTIALRWK
ncbi:hypothetical protein [Metabacillus malikii]|uniref:Uncharacterized protein n=1 Tax=Metabacillus malikii TaxID=1504265 RepID=A0ABT9Z9M4_9BACI|nr:hypothetical protein [Metabacillus malikii]MDQ0228954.1 hypothetical protein [Metabacillus malikii]